MSTKSDARSIEPDSKPPSPSALDENNPSTSVILPKEEEYITGLPLGLVVGSVTLVCFLLLLDQSILSTAIPRITSQFHSLPDVGWYTGAYQLCSAALQPLTGKLYTHFRAKHVFLIHLFVFALGSLICGVATSSEMLIGGRALAGLGASGLINGALTILSGVTSLEKRPLYTGIMLGTGQMGLVLGPLIGGALTQYATWRWCFYINLPLCGIAALILFLIHIPDLTPKPPFTSSLVLSVIPQLDLPGFALFAPGAVMFLLALQFGGDGSHPWNSSTVIGLFCGAGATVIVFCFWESRIGDEAMIPGLLLRNKIVLASVGQSMAFMVSVLVASSWLPMYFQAVKGEGPTMSGVHLLPSILSQLLFAVVSGAAVSRLGYYLPWSVFSGSVTALGNGLLSTLKPETSVAKWVIYQIVLGFGRGAGMQMPFIAVQNALPAALIPTSLALLVFTQNFAAAVGFVIANTVFTQTLIHRLPVLAPSVSPQEALDAGGSASAVRALVPAGHENELMGVLNAYSESLRNLWYMLVGFACLAFFFAFGTGWVDVRKKKEGKEGQAVSGEEKTTAEV